MKKYEIYRLSKDGFDEWIVDVDTLKYANKLVNLLNRAEKIPNTQYKFYVSEGT